MNKRFLSTNLMLFINSTTDTCKDCVISKNKRLDNTTAKLDSIIQFLFKGSSSYINPILFL